MADPTVAVEASNLFALGANFNPQSSSSVHTKTAANIMDSVGNIECETMIDGRTDYTNEFAYCNAIPAIGTDLATMLTTFGAVVDAKVPTSMTITFKAGAYATVSISGHNHDDNAHVTSKAFNCAAAVPAGAGFGVPTFTGVTVGANATPISATMTFSYNHIDKIASNGTHFDGSNLTCKVDVSVEYDGVPTTAEPMTGWTTDTYGPSDSNQDFDTYVVTAHRYFDAI